MIPYSDYAFVWLGLHAVRFEADPEALVPYTLNFHSPPRGSLPDDVVRGTGGYLHGLARAMGLKYDAICGVPPGGDQFASAFSRKTLIPQIWLELEERAGEGPRIVLGSFEILLEEINLPRDSRILLVTDVLSGGAPERRAAELLRGQGMAVTDILAIVDSEEGGREDLLKDGVRTHALCKITELMRSYRDDAYISEEQYQRAASYVAARRRRQAETA
jgi:orotate phosphoribosyltransferase